MYNGPSELIYINGSRRKVLVAPINNGNTGYVIRKSKRSEVCLLTLEQKRWVKDLEERRRGRPAEMFST